MSKLILADKDDLDKQRERHALYLESNNFALIPLKPGSKYPDPELLPTNKMCYAVWKPLAARAASDAEVEKWFQVKPNINIGLICGSVSGLYVLDVDKKPPKNIGEIPPTVTVKTGRGWHYYFKSDKEIKTVKLGEWGSLQGEGSYIVAAGSLHPDGRVYDYADMLAINEHDIADLPGWLADENKRKQYAQRNEAARAPTPTLDEEPLNTGIKHAQSENLKTAESKDGVRKNSLTCSISFENLWRLNQDPETAYKIMSLCGRDIDRIGKAFTCPIPGHSERKPSAALWQGDKEGDAVVFHDFHNIDPDRRFWPLVDVYASVLVGKPLKLGKGERSIWWLRALHEIGAVNPPVLKGYDLPGDVKKPAVKLYSGFIYLMELRQLYAPQDSAPFSWAFAGRWCGIKSANQVQQAMKYLLERGYLYMKQPGVKIGEGEGARSALFAIGRPRIRKG